MKEQERAEIAIRKALVDVAYALKYEEAVKKDKIDTWNRFLDNLGDILFNLSRRISKLEDRFREDI